MMRFANLYLILLTLWHPILPVEQQNQVGIDMEAVAYALADVRAGMNPV